MLVESYIVRSLERLGSWLLWSLSSLSFVAVAVVVVASILL